MSITLSVKRTHSSNDLNEDVFMVWNNWLETYADLTEFKTSAEAETRLDELEKTLNH